MNRFNWRYVCFSLLLSACTVTVVPDDEIPNDGRIHIRSVRWCPELDIPTLPPTPRALAPQLRNVSPEDYAQIDRLTANHIKQWELWGKNVERLWDDLETIQNRTCRRR